MNRDPFEPPGAGLATSWAAILDEARGRTRPVTLRLANGDRLSGRVTRRGESVATLETTESGTTYEHNVAIAAIVAITFAPEDDDPQAL
ncbi:MAG: hypothetical protein HOV96_16650 [Nonomuraea sp.]|nr:hypothetical protein [Nonomuraea sp.]NUP63745.1 hypothetical protein [Nonomuraea sp.]NUP79167.1 hypothetical protein [Nonomuraea sp.]NUS05430.1 hypothetical protein [Nonomuraea sp.]NUT42321.1 hypothetical protein [Thermoactinospora sp.]